MKNFSQELETLKDEVLKAFEDFFRYESVSDLRLTDQPGSTENSDVRIVGVLKSKSNISLIGESEHSDGEFYEPIENCHISDLVFIIDELHAKRYSHAN